jgi:hypothetical protein
MIIKKVKEYNQEQIIKYQEAVKKWDYKKRGIIWKIK